MEGTELNTNLSQYLEVMDEDSTQKIRLMILHSFHHLITYIERYVKAVYHLTQTKDLFREFSNFGSGLRFKKESSSVPDPGVFSRELAEFLEKGLNKNFRSYSSWEVLMSNLSTREEDGLQKATLERPEADRTFSSDSRSKVKSLEARFKKMLKLLKEPKMEHKEVKLDQKKAQTITALTPTISKYAPMSHLEPLFPEAEIPQKSRSNSQKEAEIEQTILKSLKNIGLDLDESKIEYLEPPLSEESSPSARSMIADNDSSLAAETVLSLLAQKEAFMDTSSAKTEILEEDSAFMRDIRRRENNELRLVDTTPLAWRLPALDKTIRQFYRKDEIFVVDDLGIDCKGIINCIELLNERQLLAGDKSGFVTCHDLRTCGNGAQPALLKPMVLFCEPNGFSIWDMKVDCLATLWLVNSRNDLYRAIELDGRWEARLIAEVKGFLKSRVQGKMLRLNKAKYYLFWKVSDRQLMRVEIKSGVKKVLNVEFARPFDFIADFKPNKDGTKVCTLSRYGHLVIFIVQKNSYRTLVKKFFDRFNPVFTSLAFSDNGKRITAACYDLINDAERRIELFVLRVDYSEMKAHVKYSMCYSVDVEPLQLIKHLDFLDLDKRRKMLMTLGLHRGMVGLMYTKSKALEMYSEDIPTGNENLIDFASSGSKLYLVFRGNTLRMMTPKK